MLWFLVIVFRYQFDLTFLQIQAIIRVGSPRLQAALHNKPREQRGTRVNDKTKTQDIDKIYIRDALISDGGNGASIWGHKLEPGLPCAHKGMRWYFSDGDTLKSVWHSYRDAVNALPNNTSNR